MEQHHTHDYGYLDKVHREHLLHERLVQAGIDDSKRHETSLRQIDHSRDALRKRLATSPHIVYAPKYSNGPGVFAPSRMQPFLRHSISADSKENDQIQTMKTRTRTLISIQNEEQKRLDNEAIKQFRKKYEELQGMV